MVSIEIFALVLTGLSITASIVYYANVLTNANKTRKTQLFVQLRQQQLDIEMIQNYTELLNSEWDDFDDFQLKYESSTNPLHFAKRYRVWAFLDGLGYLLHKGLIDLESCYHLLNGNASIYMWTKYRLIIEEQRIRDNNPEEWMWFEYLNDEIIKLRKKKGLLTEI